MIRYILMSFLCTSVLLVLSAKSAQAAVISRNNPYRSFNVSGVNYGSMQWERKHGRQSGTSWSSWGSSNRRFRRW